MILKSASHNLLRNVPKNRRLIYISFFVKTPAVVLLPPLSLRSLSAAAGLHEDKRASGRISEEVHRGVRNPERYHGESVDEIGIISAQLFHRIGDSRLRLHLAPTMAHELHEMRNLVRACGRAMDSAHKGAARFGKLCHGIQIARWEGGFGN